MGSLTARSLACLVVVCAIAPAARVHAQVGIGTWVRTDSRGKGMTMTVEPCCNGGRRLIYRVPGAGDITLTVESALDGADAPVLMGGKATGETMAIKRLDDLHAVAVLKMNGQPFGTSRSTISTDGKTLTVESETTTAAGGRTTGKETETWVRK